MCGFFASNFEVPIAKLSEASVALSLRGPDDIIFRSSRVGSYIFSRLSVLDLASSSMQPISHEEDSIAGIILFNGEIYNYKSLCEHYCISPSFAKSDTLFLNKVLAQTSLIDLVPDLNGMFAICQISNNFNTVSFCRDLFGQKPLYYWLSGDKWAISSDILALAKILDRPTSASFVRNYLNTNESLGTRGFYSFTDTQFRDIKSAQPACCYSIDNGKLTIDTQPRTKLWQTYFFNQPSLYYSEQEILETLSSVLRDYISIDVQYTTHFSGGIDSSLITLLTLNQTSSLSAFTKTAENIDSVASEALQLYNSVPGLSLYTQSVTPQSYINDTIEFINYSGGPPRWGTAPSMLPVYNSIRNQGYKVCLGGDGADEIFFGYQNYSALSDYLRNLPANSDLHHTLSKFSFSSRGDCHEPFDNHAKAFIQNYIDLSEEWDPNSPKQILKLLRFLDLSYFLPTISTPHADLCSMRASIELRSPFLDFRVVRLAFRDDRSVESILRNGPTKLTLRKAIQTISASYTPSPTYYLDQPKHGTRNFATTSFADFKPSRLPKDFFSDYLQLSSTLHLNSSPKAIFKVFSVFIFYLLFEKNESVNDVKSILAEYT